MGGSGGGSGYPSGGAGSGTGGGTGNDCEFEFSTTLFGPVPGIANQLSAGDVLDVRLAVDGESSAVGVFSPQLDGQQVGTLAGSNRIPDMVACLNSGVEYIARVLSVNGSQVGLRVSNR